MENWDTVKEKAGQLGKWINEKWNGIKSSTSEAWDSVKNGALKMGRYKNQLVIKYLQLKLMFQINGVK